jgi:hypothetical protein
LSAQVVNVLWHSTLVHPWILAHLTWFNVKMAHALWIWLHAHHNNVSPMNTNAGMVNVSLAP